MACQRVPIFGALRHLLTCSGFVYGFALRNEVSYAKSKGILWVKGVFWVPWTEVDTAENLKTLVEEIQIETGVHVAGVVTRYSEEEQHRALAMLQAFQKKVVWVQMPPRFGEDVLVYSFTRDEPRASFLSVRPGQAMTMTVQLFAFGYLCKLAPAW